uniref:Lipid-binding serum glycoprotein C-terminal domain-containing protein n=1 Tax=Panagrolaimus sp. PS1159 TaxID=55785 RepID=A0AC35FU32_9BILA
MLLKLGFWIFYIFFVTVDAKILVVPNAGWNHQYGFPGVKLRLTRKGADYIKNVGVHLLNEQLAQLNGFHVTHPISRPGLEGTISVTDIRTLRYQAPQAAHIQFSAPSYLILSIENAAISLAGRFLGQSGVFQVPGYVHGDLIGMSVSIVASFRATQDGLMSVQVANCSTVVAQSRFNLEPEGPLGPIVKTFELQINEAIRERIPSLFCKGLQDIIEKNSPEMFQRLTRADLSEHFQGFNSDSIVIDRFIRRFTHGLYVDNRNIADPIVTSEYFETQQRGELNYNDSFSETPFYPRPMQVDMEYDKMLYLYGSEYALNSLLYHAYENDRLTMSLEPSALPEKYQGFVRTTCDQAPAGTPDGDDFVSGICVGKLLPSIAENFPNTTTKFVMLPAALPEVKFYDGLSTMDVKTKILTYVWDKKQFRDKQILVSSADGVADIKLAAEDGRFAGDLKLRKLNVRLHRSAIDGIDPASISQLAPLAKTFLGPQLSSGLKRGFPFPLKESITFVNPDFTIRDGYARLATDFILGESKLREKVAEAFQRIKSS